MTRRLVFALVRHGHEPVWDYGYSFFLDALDELAEALKKGASGRG